MLNICNKMIMWRSHATIQKLSVLGQDVCLYNMPTDLWINDPTKWPDAQWPDFYHYLTETPGELKYWIVVDRDV
jgi:hypothetical protein